MKRQTKAGAMVRGIVRAATPPMFLGMARKGVSWLTGLMDEESPARVGIGVPYLPVSNRDVTMNSIVMACVRWSCATIAEPTIVIEEETKDGWERSPGHPAAMLVRRPQDRLADRESKFGYKQLMCATEFSLMTDGNDYVHVLKSSAGEPIGLEWIPSQACEPVGQSGYPNVLSHYRIWDGGRWDTASPTEVLHIMDGTPDPTNPLKSVSPLKSVMRQVMADNQIAVYTHAVLRHPIPSILATPKEGEADMDDETVEKLYNAMYKRTGGENAGGMAVPNVPMDVKLVGYKPDEMALDRLPKLPEERISAIYGIPAIVAGLGAGLDRSTFANFKEAREAAAEQFLIPQWSAIAQAFTDQLMPYFADDDRFRFAFDLKDVRILQEDEDKLHQRVRADWQANIIDRSEAKRRIGMDPDPKIDDGVYYYMLQQPAIPFDALKMVGANAERIRLESNV